MRRLALLLLVCACSHSSDGGGGGGGGAADLCTKTTCQGGQTCDALTGKCGCPADKRWDEAAAACLPALPAPICHEASTWNGKAQVFKDASEARGFKALPDTYGVRISAADIDGDGWADLILRRAGTVASTADAHTVWLLHNDHGTFSDVTQSSGFLTPRHDDGVHARPAEIVVFADVDNDGDLDAFAGVDATAVDAGGAPVTNETSELMVNDGHGHFTLGPDSEPFRLSSAPFSAATFTDYDRDGHIDLFLGEAAAGGVPQQDRLYHGGPDLSFTDVVDTAGVKTRTPDPSNPGPWNDGLVSTWSWSVAACDLNGDGTPELLSASYGRAPNNLWLGKRDESGNVTFINRSVASGYAYDGRIDWTDNQSARCWCHLHPTDQDCGGVPPPDKIVCNTDADAFRWNHATDRQLYRLGGNNGTSVCADFNNDGWLDILTSTIVHWDVGSSSDPSEILYNKQDNFVSFARPGNETTGLVRPHPSPDWNDGDMTNAVLDFDNDGRMDVLIASSDYPGTRAWLFHQTANQTFEPVPIDLGVDLRAAHGVSIADFDRDGDLDIVLGHSEARCPPGADQCYPADQRYARFFENVLGQSGNYIQLRLEGIPGTNRSAIGARVTVEAGGLTQVQEVEGGHGHFGIENDQVLHFGLGAACEAVVAVRWPDAALTTERFTVGAGHRYRVVQGSGPVADDP